MHVQCSWLLMQALQQTGPAVSASRFLWRMAQLLEQLPGGQITVSRLRYLVPSLQTALCWAVLFECTSEAMLGCIGWLANMIAN